jgi:hypothetical protein
MDIRVGQTVAHLAAYTGLWSAAPMGRHRRDRQLKATDLSCAAQLKPPQALLTTIDVRGRSGVIARSIMTTPYISR